MKKYNILERIKIWLERTPGYSWCSHCGKTWDKVENKSIPYDAKIPYSNSGMFPLCTKCFDELSSDEILKYCQELVDKWKKDKTLDKNIDFDIVKSNIDYMKQNSNISIISTI